MRLLNGFLLLAGLLALPDCRLSAQATTGTVFTRVDEPPRFPDSAGAATFVAEHLVYPEATRRAGQQGKVIVRFVVEPDGRLTEVNVLHSPDASAAAAVTDVVRAMPRWIPGRLRGKPVRTAVVLPVHFGLR